ncbi:rhomboid family intramembrane serine protease [Pseudodesulfovibrio indicus]|uniref:Membrane associated rhomboid family serine protease n=1 Tax=Pseudodesulfovibrio indicus TaxID=1716143 RepID=A0A126QQG4_9BACT|nr:rhomboid family intramembrane serine protease [Pseudodesulfovibrio indicus]AMK12333.1 rhomboid family intramembrane serine protease [Pseudodesulfovibrio indicus]TDT90620.1 membrane associated rhomboid family serine protease [Pseudodesulfovibrio indicus]
MIPLRSNVPRVTIPYAVSAIIAVNVLAFLYVRTLDPHAVARLYHLFGVVPARFMEPDWAVWAGYPKTLGWPLVTYMFLHGGWLHLILNMWMLWLFGDNIEDVTGHGWFVLFYLLCGLAAVGTHMVFEGSSPMPVVGASGAVAGVLGAYIVLYPHGRVLTLIPVFFFPFIFRIPASLFLGFWFLLQVFSGIYSKVQGAQDVAWWAHVGGFVAGIVLIRWFRLPGVCRYCYNPDSKDYDREDSALPPL